MPDSTIFRDLPADSFPFTVTATGAESGKVHWQVTVEGPGVLQVPPLAKMHREAINIRVSYPDRTYDEDFPHGETRD